MTACRNPTSGRNSDLNLNYTLQAVADLEQIQAHIAVDNPAVADLVVARILQSIAVLENFPLIGRQGRVEGTREWSITGLPYVAIYAISAETDLDILTIVHTRRQWPPEVG